MIRLLLLWCLFACSVASAEPWLANRYAQNCASCHAPGRRNLVTQDRRCTATCKGCHVNPSGSGLRNQYGKWNENNWLKSYRTDTLAHMKSFAPIKDQKYATKPPDAMKTIVAQKGYSMKYLEAENMDEKQYDRKVDGSEKITESYWDDWLFRIPEEDPYREMRRTKIDGGGDFRWQVTQLKIDSTQLGETVTVKKWQNFLMSADLGLRWRPVFTHLNFVYEGRFFGNPGEKIKGEKELNSLSRRSFYALVDDLPFNTFAQVGFYRPLFGNPTPDHTALVQVMLSQALVESSRSFDLQYQTISLGASPGIPFLNVHMLGKQVGSVENDTHKGFGVNVGGHIVPFGFSAMYSYWNTQKDMPQGLEFITIRTELQSLVLGGQFGPTTATLDFTAMTKDIPNDGFRQGGVITLETNTALYRAIYGVFTYADANTSETLNPGKGNQIRAGVRGFLYPGTDVSLLLTQEKQSTEKVDSRTAETSRKTSGLMLQFHGYM